MNNVNPYPNGLIFLNFQPLEVVSRYRNPQPQVSENYSYLLTLSSLSLPLSSSSTTSRELLP